VAGFGSSTVGVIDTRGNVMVGKFGVGGPARAVGVSPDATRAYVLVGARCVVIDLEQALASMGGS
jgi:DNA-binding beta-propeller fold protein YncE